MFNTVEPLKTIFYTLSLTVYKNKQKSCTLKNLWQLFCKFHGDLIPSKNIFQSEKVCLEDLVKDYNASDLKAMGIPFGDSKKIMRKVEVIREEKLKDEEVHKRGGEDTLF